MHDTVRNMIANISQTMAGDPEFEFLVGFWHFPGQVTCNLNSLLNLLNSYIFYALNSVLLFSGWLVRYANPMDKRC